MTAASNEYAKALFSLGEETGCTEEILSDLGDSAAAISDNPKYALLLDTPAVKKEEKLSLIDQAFESVHPYLLNLIKILCERRCVTLISEILTAFTALYDEARGIERVTAISAIAMNEEQLSLLRSKLERQTGKTVIIKNTVDPTILGGVLLRYSGIQIDASVRSRLDKLEASLKDLIV